MKLLGRLHPSIEEVFADEVRPGLRLAAGRYQAFSMSNVDSAGEVVVEVDHAADGLIYIVGCAAPGFCWTLEPTEPVMIEKENRA